MVKLVCGNSSTEGFSVFPHTEKKNAKAIKERGSNGPERAAVKRRHDSVNPDVRQVKERDNGDD